MDRNAREKSGNLRGRRNWRGLQNVDGTQRTRNWEDKNTNRTQNSDHKDIGSRNRGSGRNYRNFVLSNKQQSEKHPLRKNGGLENISTRFDSNNTEALIAFLANENNQFQTFLTCDDLTLKEFQILLELLAKICLDKEFGSNKTTIITQACQKHFIARFQRFLVEASSNEEDICHIVNLIVEFLETAKKILQFLIFESKTEINVLYNITKSLLAENNISATEILSRFDLLRKEIQEGADTLKQQNLQVSRARKRAINSRYLDPPTDDFREIDILPTYTEITSQYRPKLWPNIIDGSYLDAEHYLGVQYRLLREDFLRPLREGIGNYLNKDAFAKKMDSPSVRIYPKVNFITYVYEEEANSKKINQGHLIQFQLYGKKQIDWKYSKRFMFGSLLCFSKNNFETVLFATVENRDEQYLKNNEILIKFFDSSYEHEDIYNNQFVMVESEVYFEPYYQVLKTLKTFDDDNFPMTDYIIELKTLEKPPKFLETQAAISPVVYKYFAGVPSEHAMLMKRSLSLNIFDINQWPTKEEMGLDDSQRKALHSALTNELSVIQGPPGTGKTFLALKIVETLIRNQEMEEPILVISLTNHALDQFLVGILNVTDEIVRIGGQSKCTELEKYNLRRFKRGGYCFDQYRELEKLHEKMMNVLKKIALVKNFEGIVPLKDVAQLIPNVESKFSDLYSWLLDYDIQEFLSLRSGSDIILFSEISEAISSKYTELEYKYQEMYENYDEEDYYSDYKIQEFESMLNSLHYTFEAIKELRTQLKCSISAQHFDEKNFDIDIIPQDNRLSVYIYWANLLIQFYENQKEALVIKIRVLGDEIEKMKLLEDADLLKEFKVIGMTTNGGARLHKLLKLVKCRRVIVEEAAEVMETHIISCLNQHCEQLILIGDHKQLRPNISVYELGKHFNFDVSLFERLVSNGINCQTLQVQHRMAPEIATLIVPSIYPTLFNDNSVLTRQCIDGFQDNAKRMFFITHSYPEQQDNEISSRRNEHEADFIVSLYEHLILQGYSPEQITILSAYKGQMFSIKRKLERFDEKMRKVNNTVVDNYQGEENVIILLSLVRSNDEQKIGFLATDNRVCVALSRARNALYVIGNMDLLSSKSELWTKIRTSFQALNAIGKALPLRCIVHPEETCSVSTAADFRSFSPFGGCKQICTFELKCGHMCGRTCHSQDQEHENIKCLPTNRCKRKCAANLHFCQKYCIEECGECMVKIEKELRCGHKLLLPCSTRTALISCIVIVEKTFKDCKHVTNLPCHERACPMDCGETLKCGHMCDQKCHKKRNPNHTYYACKQPCTKISKLCSLNHTCKRLCHEACSSCEEVIFKKLSCGHSVEMLCSGDPSREICKEKCRQILSCGHWCKKKCSEPCEPCTVEVEKTIPDCGHLIKLPCHKQPTKDDCIEQCNKALKCGHSCSNKCKEPCIEHCNFIVDNVEAACGHQVPLFCWEKSEGIRNPIHDKKACKGVCGKLLECGHFCKEKCGNCLQGRFHSNFCQEKCNRILVCGRRCNLKCGMPCSTCYPYTCKHANCNQTTCNICVPLNEMHYKFKCTHHDCSKTCAKKSCNRPPCNKNCEKLLPCGHECFGLCGEKCPKLCWICHREKLILESMSSKPVENPRFYLLPDCEHIMEITSLEQWFDWQESVVRFLTCPICNVRITKSLRYRNKVRKIYIDLKTIQDALNSTMDQQKKKSSKIKNEIDQLTTTCIQYGDNVYQLFTRIQKNLEDSRSNLPNRIKCLELAEIQLSVLKHIKNMFNNIHVTSEMKDLLGNIMQQVLQKVDQRYYLQAAADISNEMLKFHYLAHGLAALTTEESKHELVEIISLPRRFTCEVQEECLELIYRNVEMTFKMPNFDFKMKIPRQTLQAFWFKCSQGHINPISYVRNKEKIKFCNKCEMIVTEMEPPLFPYSKNNDEQQPIFCNTDNFSKNLQTQKGGGGGNRGGRGDSRGGRGGFRGGRGRRGGHFKM